ncbi:MAG: GFA family protein [Phenylobacterium sp.]|uniref:GFA family protein n=1 Tax=Phenylobacterium sp. TaxID=1871053 RepID=UPI001A5893E1|nr:GFA family protein [Phenylobacterium sp.]MBL8770951.1 GFA family protein [Phenylobacterium sp.]
MTTRTARCFCGDYAVTLEGDPLLVSSCCCTRCQRRTGSFFGVTAYFRPSQMVARSGEERTFRLDDATTRFRQCARCGTSVWYAPDDDGWGEDILGVAGGCFADPTLPGPHRMTHAATGHPFVTSPKGVPVYEDGPPE